jgi:hypothetical protein
LFGDSDPIGKSVSVAGKQFTVIGVFHTKAGFLKTMDGTWTGQAARHPAHDDSVPSPRRVASRS